MRNFNSRRVLFDTNVLLDAIDARRTESQEACLALKHCNGGGDMGLVSPSSLKDAYYVLTKRYGEKPARQAVQCFMELLVVLPLEQECCSAAAFSNEPDFEDGLIRAAAELNDVAFILTRDKKAFAYSQIRAVTCAEYLQIIAAEEAALARRRH